MYKTEQENFWAQDFGESYISRNNSSELLASNLNFFAKALNTCDKITSCVEFGANIGMNLKAFQLLYPGIDLKAVEINEKAAQQLESLIGGGNVFNGSILDYQINGTSDLSLIKGVLIHINPEMLQDVYRKLYEASHKYILIGEYYNPSPVTIEYRGHKDRLFKRDFAGEFLDKYSDVELVDYGFAYRRDKSFPQDDITWFLLKK
jgi:pseudaminic acid biosynthesis-associated methylase